MKVNAHLDVDVVAHETDDTLTVLLELDAPEPTTVAVRPASGLQVVLDRSGSMAGPRLEGAKAALLAVVDRLDPRDVFGLVAFDQVATVVVPAGPLTDKAAVKRAIEAVHPGGSTDLAAGYLRGLQEARRAATPAGTTVLLVSDGHANAGETSPEVLGGVAELARGERITTSTLGYGLGYDERLLSALAKGGAGGEHFAENPDDAAAHIAAEVDGLLSQAVQAASVLVAMSPHVKGVTVHNDLPVHPVADGVQIELGALWAGEQRRVVLSFDVPGIAALGLAEIAELRLSYVELPELRQVDVTLPLTVNVVPGDVAAGRVRDPEVRAELAYQQAQAAKREAADRLADGDIAGAAASLDCAMSMSADAYAAAPASMHDMFADDMDALRTLRAEALTGDASRAAKRARSDAAHRSRTRGRER